MPSRFLPTEHPVNRILTNRKCLIENLTDRKLCRSDSHSQRILSVSVSLTEISVGHVLSGKKEKKNLSVRILPTENPVGKFRVDTN